MLKNRRRMPAFLFVILPHTRRFHLNCVKTCLPLSNATDADCRLPTELNQFSGDPSDLLRLTRVFFSDYTPFRSTTDFSQGYRLSGPIACESETEQYIAPMRMSAHQIGTPHESSESDS